MRVAQPLQMVLGEVDIADIQFDPQSRDDIPRVLCGLQHVYKNAKLRQAIFDVLESDIAPKISKDTGRPGMPLWNILVCGVIRLDLNIDYDRLHELVNHHDTLRLMLGHSPSFEYRYAYQTLVDNVHLLTPALLEKINVLIVKEGHALSQKGESEGEVALRGRCDSFVLETDVHHPTDISLLMDAMRKIITLTAQWCEDAGLSDWRKYRSQLKVLKRLVRRAQSSKHTQKITDATASEETASMKAHRELIERANQQIAAATAALSKLMRQDPSALRFSAIENFIEHANRQIDQITRRVLQGETIPHAEKVFSIFEPHTEWIVKGKAGVPKELGVRVAIVEDQYRFILNHRVMCQETDEKIAVDIVTDTQRHFPNFRACSFDKGFHSPSNQTNLKAILDQLTLPRKGKPSAQVQAEQTTPAFIAARRAHSAVESAINALEVHGLDKCYDRGINGFKRYVALAIVTRNIHRIGDIVWQQKAAQEKRRAAARLGRSKQKAA